MTNRELQSFTGLLESTRAELEASLQAGAADRTPVSPDNAIGRLTRQDAMQAQQMALEMRRRNEIRLAQVKAALERIAEGEYGICPSCEEDIPVARLKVRPEAVLCVACAEKR